MRYVTFRSTYQLSDNTSVLRISTLGVMGYACVTHFPAPTVSCIIVQRQEFSCRHACSHNSARRTSSKCLLDKGRLSRRPSAKSWACPKTPSGAICVRSPLKASCNGCTVAHYLHRRLL